MSFPREKNIQTNLKQKKLQKRNYAPSNLGFYRYRIVAAVLIFIVEM